MLPQSSLSSSHSLRIGAAAHFDLHELFDLSAANRTLIVLNADDLAARLAQAEVAAGQHDRVGGLGVADDAQVIHIAHVRAIALLHVKYR